MNFEEHKRMMGIMNVLVSDDYQIVIEHRGWLYGISETVTVHDKHKLMVLHALNLKEPFLEGDLE